MSADNYWTVIPTVGGKWQPRMGFMSDLEDSGEFPEERDDHLRYDTLSEAEEAGADAYERDTEYGYLAHPVVQSFPEMRTMTPEDENALVDQTEALQASIGLGGLTYQDAIDHLTKTLKDVRDRRFNG